MVFMRWLARLKGPCTLVRMLATSSSSSVMVSSGACAQAALLCLLVP